MTTEWWKMKKEKHEKNIRIDTNRISGEKDIREEYKKNLQTRMENEPFNSTITPQEDGRRGPPAGLGRASGVRP